MLSIIIPVYNEERNLLTLNEELSKITSNLREDFEIIFINDGSSDSSISILRDLKAKNSKIKVINLTRNYGQHAALAAGFDNCAGNYIIILDADLQNEPSDILKLYEKLKEGYDFASGWRRERKDPFFSRKLPSKLINIMTSRVTNVDLHDYHCGLKGFSRKIIADMKDFSEMRRCIPALAAKLCKKPIEIEVSHRKREGKSKYNIWGLVGLYFDFYINFAKRPFQILAVAGIAVFCLSLVASFCYALGRITGFIAPVPVFLYIMIFAGINSIQLMIFGMLGEYLIRVYKVVQDKSLYKIESVE